MDRTGWLAATRGGKRLGRIEVSQIQALTDDDRLSARVDPQFTQNRRHVRLDSRLGHF